MELLQSVTLTTSTGLRAQFTNYGARMVSMWVPDRLGKFEDVVLGFDNLSDYSKAGERYHGAIVGRVCGRISNARFFISGTEHLLASNDAYGYPVANHLHGGIHALHNRVWSWEKWVNKAGDESVTFSCFSPDGEEGYPGNLHIEVTYTLKESGILRMECHATTDKRTPVNLTNHTFFNLQGSNKQKNILSHLLTINSEAIIECDNELIPTGQLLLVKDTPLDFRKPKLIAESLMQKHSQIQQDKGYSIAYALSSSSEKLNLAATLSDEISGRRMDIYTNQPSIQVYTAYFMDGSDVGKNNIPYFDSAGVALETQGFPDAPNQPNFPSVFLEKGDDYCHQTEYRFSVN